MPCSPKTRLSVPSNWPKFAACGRRGELLHKSGQHAESVQVLKQALDLLQTAD